MISRYKWYEARLPKGVKDLFYRLEAQTYSPQKSSGFIVDSSNSRFRYIWKSTISTAVLDDEGNAELQEISTVNSQDVAIHEGRRIVFRVENPARSLKDLLNTLEEIVGFGFTCEPISLKEEFIHEALSEIDNKKLNSLKVSGAIHGARAVARIELVAKDGLEREKNRAFTFW